MSDIKKPYNPYQEQVYKLTYSSNPQKRVPATHFCVYYNGKPITNGKSYALCQIDLKEFRMMGVRFPNKDLLTIKPYKG